MNVRREGGDGLLAATVVTAGYLPYARVLAESFLEHHPDGDFVALVSDDVDCSTGAGEPFRVLRPHDIGIDDEERDARGLMYGPVEYVCSMRPAFLRHLIRSGASVALLLDGDGCVYGDLTPIAELARERGTVLSPHFTAPHPAPGEAGSLEIVQLGYGLVNSGFAVAGSGSLPYLDWLDARLARYCMNMPERNLYSDQRWADLAIGMFDHVMLNDPGCNVMCLNLHYRDVEWGSGTPSMPEGPLRYFHFLLGFDPFEPELICNREFAERWLPYLSERPGAQRLAREYGARLIERGYRSPARPGYRFANLPDGSPVDRHMRAAYRRGVLGAEHSGEPAPPNPFGDGDTERFLAWLSEPVGDERSDFGLTRYIREIQQLRPDLAAVFPGVPGQHTGAFLDWVESERASAWMRAYADERLTSIRLGPNLTLDRRMRAICREALQDVSCARPPSLSDGDAGRLLEWLNEPDGERGDGSVSRYLKRVWSERADLQLAFPEITGGDRGRFLAWVDAEADRPEVAIAAELRPTGA